MAIKKRRSKANKARKSSKSTKRGTKVSRGRGRR